MGHATLRDGMQFSRLRDLEGRTQVLVAWEPRVTTAVYTRAMLANLV
jgi:hypothetical protein